MPVFKLSFLKNNILSITEAEPTTDFDGNVFFEQTKGQMIFAIVRAEDTTSALEIAKEIVNSLPGQGPDM